MSAPNWDERYDSSEYFYGTEPNDFVVEMEPRIPPGPVLCIAEGEGRNAVFLALQGHGVTAMDASAVGLRKARELAVRRGAVIETVAADLAEFDMGNSAWAAVISTWGHLPQPLRRTVHAGIVRALAPGGVVILEAYTPAQLKFGTGGPRDVALLMSLEELRGEFLGLELEIAREIQREVREGRRHSGPSAVVQILGRKGR